jgi:hypothetical protein
MGCTTSHFPDTSTPPGYARFFFLTPQGDVSYVEYKSGGMPNWCVTCRENGVWTPFPNCKNSQCIECFEYFDHAVYQDAVTDADNVNAASPEFNIATE